MILLQVRSGVDLSNIKLGGAGQTDQIMWTFELTNAIMKFQLVKDVFKKKSWLKMFIDPKEHKNIVNLQKAISYPFMLGKEEEHK